jgi:hypothetical protein
LYLCNVVLNRFVLVVAAIVEILFADNSSMQEKC